MRKEFTGKNKKEIIRAVVVGMSAGGMKALEDLVAHLPEKFSLPLIVVQHLHPDSEGYLAEHLKAFTPLVCKEAEESEPLRPGHIYSAPAGYHLFVEETEIFSLSIDEPVHYARPSIDVLFESASDAYGPALAAVILTGANGDGAAGVRKIKERGGLVFVQDPETAEALAMPLAALEALKGYDGADGVLSPAELGQVLAQL